MKNRGREEKKNINKGEKYGTGENPKERVGEERREKERKSDIGKEIDNQRFRQTKGEKKTGKMKRE